MYGPNPTRLPQKKPEPGTPLLLKFPQKDPQTRLPWFSDVRNILPDYEFAEMAGQKGSSSWNRKRFWRGYVAYDPSELEQIRVWVNRNSDFRGIRALRLRGTRKMGVSTMGVWMNNRDYVVQKSEKMNIQGN